MSFLRETLSDLVERRLWPVAALLVAALVAVPLVLAKSPPAGDGGEGDAAPAPLAAAPSPAVPTAPAVNLADAAPAGARLRGEAKNPFRLQHAPKEPATAAPGATGTAATAGDTGSGGSGAPSGGATPTPPQQVYVHASIDVRFRKATGRPRLLRDVPRLTPLPGPANPVAIFLGMRKDLETAVFMISSDVHVQGEGRCVPSRRTCEAVQLEEGETVFLDVTAADGSVTQYELVLVDVTLHETTSKAEAQSAYARVSRAGARIVRRRAVTSNVGTTAPPPPFRYARREGVLHIALGAWRHRTHRLRANGAATRPQAVADARAVPAP